MLEECDIQEEEMHAQMVRHAYTAAEMCREGTIEVRLPELALGQAAALLAKPDGMGAADRACDKHLRKAVAQAHTMWDKEARMVDAERPHSVTKLLRRHRQARREEQ